MAFEEVCPERIDLIHKNYRKLCNLLIDVEEWGQVVIINMLTRYARTQFLSPNQNVSLGASGCPGHLGVPPATLVPGMLQDRGASCCSATVVGVGWWGEVECCWQESLLEESTEKAFYGSEEEDTKDAKAEAASLAKRKPYVMDPDHRLLLRNTKPLLQSRNAAVSPRPVPKATSSVQPGLMMSPSAKKPPGCWESFEGTSSGRITKGWVSSGYCWVGHWGTQLSPGTSP